MSVELVVSGLEADNSRVSSKNTAAGDIAQTFLSSSYYTPAPYGNDEERQREMIAKNIALLEKANIIIDREKDKLILPLILCSAGLEEIIILCLAIEIYDIEFVYGLVYEIEEELKTGFLDAYIFEDCYNHYGPETLRSILTSDGSSQPLGENKEKLPTRRHLLNFCSNAAFPSGEYMPLMFRDEEPYRLGEEVIVGAPKVDSKMLSFIGSYPTELRYLTDTLGVPFETLICLEKYQVALFCGTIRTLRNSVRGLTNQRPIEFTNKREVIPFTPQQLFHNHTIATFGMLRDSVSNPAFTKIKEFCLFLSEHGTKKLISPLEKRDVKRINSFIERKSDRYLHPAKNMYLVRSLFQNLSIGSPAQYLLTGGDGGTISTKELSDNRFLRWYVKTTNSLELRYAGLYSIGGKIHFSQAISEEKIDQFRKSYGFQHTPFTLLHANTSLLLPPSYFPEELMFMIGAMNESGLFDNTDPQLQISIPGRMPNDLGGILASTMILLSEQHVEYTPESFATQGHDNLTGRLMVAYDDGVYVPTFKYNSKEIAGRTDVLLLKDMKLLTKAKIIGSLLSQTIYGGWFQELGKEFIAEYIFLLKKHSMERILDMPWIYSGDNTGKDVLEHHFSAVKAVGDQQYNDRKIYNQTQDKKGLLVFELANLLTKCREKIQLIQKKFI